MKIKTNVKAGNEPLPKTTFSLSYSRTTFQYNP